MPLRDIALAVAIAAIWGVSFIAIKIGVGAAPPLFLTALRFFLAALPAVFFIKRPSTRLFDLAGYGLSIGLGQFGLLFIAIRFGMPAGLASLVIQIQAFFTMALAHFVIGQPIGRGQIAGAAIAFAGVALIGSGLSLTTALPPFLAVVAAAAFWGLGNLFSIRAGRVDMVAFVIWSSLFSPPPLLALSLMLEDRAAIWRAISQPSLAVWGSALFLAYVATIFGFGLWSRLLSLHQAARIAPFALLVPVFGMSSAAVVFHEPLTIRALSGAAIVFAGLAVTIFWKKA